MSKTIYRRYSEYKRIIDTFEQRFDSSTQSFYYFNPYTGEVTFQKGSIVNRKLSLWCPPEIPSSTALLFDFLPVYYLSRTWGWRPFSISKFKECYELAVVVIQAVGRGYLARKSLQKYFGARYCKILDNASGYYYFYDNFNDQVTTNENSYSENKNEVRESSWYKPLLAFPTDISVLPSSIDPEDYLSGNRLSYSGFTRGPYYCIGGVGKKSALVKTKIPNFISDNEWRDSAVCWPSEINIDDAPLGTIIAWMDGLKAIEYKMTDYAILRSAVCGNDWALILDTMKKYDKYDKIRLFGLHSLAKTNVPYDHSKRLTEPGVKAYHICMSLIRDEHQNVPILHRIFALRALHNILSTSAGRSELLNTDPPPASAAGSMSGGDNKRYSDRYSMTLITANIAILIRVVMRIPMRPVVDYSTATNFAGAKGTSSSKDVLNPPEPVEWIPSRRGIDAAEMAIKCIGLLAHNQDHRELLAENCAHGIIEAIKLCSDESSILSAGLQTLYNFCYRCESGQETVLQADGRFIINLSHSSFPGDFDIQRHCRRLELALEPDGWRGNVEAAIELEMNENSSDEKDYWLHRQSADKSLVEEYVTYSGDINKDTQSEVYWNSKR